MGRLRSILRSVEASWHSGLGYWRQQITDAVELLQQQVSGGGSSGGGTRTFVQAKYVETELDDGPGQPNVTEGTDIIFDEVPFGTIPYDNTTGIFTLAAGKTYRLTGNFVAGDFVGDGSFMKIVWVDANTNLPLRGGAGEATLYPVTGAQDFQQLPVADILYTAGAGGAQVKLRCTAFGLDSATVEFGSNAIVVEA